MKEDEILPPPVQPHYVHIFFSVIHSEKQGAALGLGPRHEIWSAPVSSDSFSLGRKASSPIRRLC